LIPKRDFGHNTFWWEDLSFAVLATLRGYCFRHPEDLEIRTILVIRGTKGAVITYASIA
jgi:hypothetical protein